jgi:hypothetical protein
MFYAIHHMVDVHHLTPLKRNWDLLVLVLEFQLHYSLQLEDLINVLMKSS